MSLSPTMWEPRSLPLGGIGVGWLTCDHSSVHLWKKVEINKGEGGYNSRNAHFGITYRLRATQKWSNIIICVEGNIIVIFLSCKFFKVLVLTINLCLLPTSPFICSQWFIGYDLSSYCMCCNLTGQWSHVATTMYTSLILKLSTSIFISIVYRYNAKVSSLFLTISQSQLFSSSSYPFQTIA